MKCKTKQLTAATNFFSNPFLKFTLNYGWSGTGPGHAQVSPVVIFVHQMVACPEGYQAGIVGWRWDGDGTGAAHIGVAQLVGEQLQLVRREAVVIPQYVVMRGATGALKR